MRANGSGEGLQFRLLSDFFAALSDNPTLKIRRFVRASSKKNTLSKYKCVDINLVNLEPLWGDWVFSGKWALQSNRSITNNKTGQFVRCNRERPLIKISDTNDGRDNASIGADIVAVNRQIAYFRPLTSGRIAHAGASCTCRFEHFLGWKRFDFELVLFGTRPRALLADIGEKVFFRTSYSICLLKTSATVFGAPSSAN